MWNRILRYVKVVATFLINVVTLSSKPVERDRRMFGGSGFGMFKSAVIIAIIVPIAIIFVSSFFKSAPPVSKSETSAILAKDISGDSHYWSVLSQYMDPGNLPNAKGKGRFWAFFSAVAGIFCLSGFAVSSLIALIGGFTEKWKKGLIRYDVLFENYVLIIGVNEQAAAIIRRALRRDDVDYVLIQTRQDVEKLRMRLALDLDREDEKKLVFYCAERISREDIEDLHLEKAVEVYILGEDVTFDNEEDHDAFNIECLEHISKYMENEQVAKQRRDRFGDDTRLTCHVDFEYQSTFTSFRATHIYQRLDKVVEFHPFNLHEIWAKKVLVDNFAVIPTGKKGEMTVQRYLPLDGDGITCDSNKCVHLIIMGMNQMGTAFGIQAALLAHYPNFKKDNNLKTTITFIDDQAIKEGEFLRGRFESLFDLSCYRVIDCKKEKLVYSADRTSWGKSQTDSKYSYLQKDGNFMDIHWEFVQGNVANDDVKKYISDIAEDTEHNITTIAICFNHPQQALATALYLPRLVYSNALQVLTYQQNSFDILNNVANGEKEWKRYKNLYPFGMIDSSYTESIFDDSRAKIVNYLFVNRNDRDVKERLQRFDSSLIPEIEQTWEYLSLVDKQSNMDMVDSISGKLRSILLPINAKYHGNPNRVKDELENKDYSKDLVDALAYSEHMRWLTERLIMGYRPLEEEEYAAIESGKRDKEYYKITHRAHLDICSNERLAVVDEKAPLHDINNILNLPLILRCTEWYNFKYTLNKDNNKSGKISLLRSFLLHGTNKSRRLSFRYVEANKSESKDACHHPFWIADSPLTREQWYIVTGQNRPKEDEKDLPRVDISKEDIEDFLLILRKRTGLYFTLPSEKEWREAALRSTGYLSNAKDWSSIICYDREDKKNGAWPARSRSAKQKNPINVYDMVGNVWEWTRTKAENHPNTFYFCGGSWRFKRLECCLNDDYWKNYWASSLREDDLGCRLLWKFDVKPEEAKMLEQELLSNAKNIKTTNDVLIQKWLDKHMVDVEDGFFVMGTENEETVKNRSAEYPRKSPWVCEFSEENETPYHYVHISKFKICSVPVTQELWNLVMGTTSRTNPSKNIGNNLPQTNVSYRTIVDEFLVKLNELTGKEYRLPTEAEWEYVAKGGHTHPISMMLSKMYQEQKNLKCADASLKSVQGYNLYAGSDNYDEVAWTKENTNGTRPVAQKKPISDTFKVYDMSGNVWEWCYDFYQSDIYNDCVKGINREKIQKEEDRREKAYPELGFISNPVCLTDEYSAHVFRGGSWLFGAIDSRCTRPNYWIDSNEDVDLGFRLAITE